MFICGEGESVREYVYPHGSLREVHTAPIAKNPKSLSWPPRSNSCSRLVAADRRV